MEMIKTAVKVGNGAGVLLPKKWLNSKVKIVLQPLNIEEDILDILINEGILEEIKGVYLTGSYARQEQSIDSDVDVLVVTQNINKKIEKGRYEIICISKKELEKHLKENALPILSMIKEAKPIVNSELLSEYKDSKLTKKNLKWHIETTKSAMNVIKADIGLSKEMDKKKIGDGIAYSLILRLRTLYIVDCIRKNKIWKKRDFLRLVKKISGSLTAYERYISSKNKNTLENKLLIEEAEKLMDYINKKVRELEKWLKEKKD